MPNPWITSPRYPSTTPWMPYSPWKEHGTRDTLPHPVNRLTDSSENISFPQLQLRAVKRCVTRRYWYVTRVDFNGSPKLKFSLIGFRYHSQMASIVSQIEVLVHSVLSDRSGNWPNVIGRNHPTKASNGYRGERKTS